MKRRDFLKIAGAAMIGLPFSNDALAGMFFDRFREKPSGRKENHARRTEPGKGNDSTDGYVSDGYLMDKNVKNYLRRMRHFGRHFEDDVYVEPGRMATLDSVCKRLRLLQSLVGHANYSLTSFDQAVRFARNYSRIRRFPKKEIDFLEEIFYADASQYGFFAEKPIENLTNHIKKRDVKKIKRTGNYLYRGAPHGIYKKIIEDAGVPVILTSGIRNVMKQMSLFLDKAWRNRGNLSLASRSLAPPGYSFHGTSDFDVGQIGLGAANFTDKFSKTVVFKRLEELGYLKLRYPMGNFSGVRFEPWHIKVKA